MNSIDKNKLFLLEQVVRKNFSSRYKDSVLGILWSVLQPLLMVILLTIVFSTMFSRSIENFPVYLMAGRTMFRGFTATVGESIGAIKGNANIIQKTAAPKYIFILGSIISSLIDFGISFLLLIGLMIVTGATFPVHTIPLAIIPIISLLIMATGASFIMSILNVYYSDIRHLWTVVVQLIMYASALFYPMDHIPMYYRRWLLLNPVFWIIDQFRDFFVYGQMHNLLNIVNSLLLSAIILVFGIILYKKYEKRATMHF